MVALNILDIKDFMNKLLCNEMFDNFLLQEATILNGATFVIDGHITEGFYTTEEMEIHNIADYKILPFRMLRANCYDLIKGKKTPDSFKFVFLLSPDNLLKTVDASGSSYKKGDVSGMFMNIKYQNHILSLTTGVSYNIFSVDKSLEFYWDNMTKKFLKKNEISFEEL